MSHGLIRDTPATAMTEPVRDPGAVEEQVAPGVSPEPPAVPDPQGPLDPVPYLPQPPAERRTRAGRDLPAAIGVSVGLGAVVLASLYVERWLFVPVLMLAVTVGVWELGSALAVRGINVPLVPVLVGGVAMQVAAYRGGIGSLVMTLLLTALAVLAWRVGGPSSLVGARPTGLRDVTAGIFAAVYVPFLAGFAALMLREDDGADRILLFILVVAASDIGGYAAGATLGRHPMSRTVSPKKSWEGFAGSVVGCSVVGALAAPALTAATWWQGVLLGLGTVLTATLGDLGESMIKRDLGIKDMGSLLPGHGGLMDRLDSLLPTAPVAYLVLAAAIGTI